MAESDRISRKRLHELVWSKPAREVARDLGISDVALGKLCRKLQVPKPPRGYWARVNAGQSPPKSPLPPLNVENPADTSQRRPGTRLSPRKLAVFQELIAAVRERGTEPRYELRGQRLTAIDSYLASELIVRLERRLNEPADDRSVSYQQAVADRRTYAGLVDALLAHTADTLVLFELDEAWGRYAGDRRPEGALLRLTPELRRRIARAHHMVTSNQKSFVALPAGAEDAAWRVTYLREPSGGPRVETTVCVSREALWLRVAYTNRLDFNERRRSWLESKPHSLFELVPVSALSVAPVAIEPSLSEPELGPYWQRLASLAVAERELEQALDAWSRSDSRLTDTGLYEMVRVMLPDADATVLDRARDVVDATQHRLEAWERRIQAERARLVEVVCGVTRGDVLQFKGPKGPEAIVVEHLDCLILDERVVFSFEGRRFRKDAALGKRRERASTEVKLSATSKAELERLGTAWPQP